MSSGISVRSFFVVMTWNAGSGLCSLCAPLPFMPEPSQVNVRRSDNVRVAAAGTAPPAPDDLLTLIPLDAPCLPARFALELETGTVVAHDGNTHGLYFFRERLADLPFHKSA